MDSATDQHVEKARRSPTSVEPRSFGGKVLTPEGEEDLRHLVNTDLAPGQRFTGWRHNKAVEALERSLEKAMPIEEIDGPDGTIFRARSKCTACKGEVILETTEEEGGKPGLYSRAVAAGVIRRLPGTFICEGCAVELEAEEERSKFEEKLRERVSLSNLDEALRGFEFSQMKAADGRGLTIGAARDWASEEFPDPRGLCLFGNKGAGKTRLAATATWQRLRSYHVTWISWPVLLAELGAAFNDSARQKAISVLTGKGALVLDDIARDEKEKVSDWAKTQLFAAIDRRIQAGAPLLITTNLQPSAIGEVLGEAIMSRVVGYSRVLELPGQDMRLNFNFDGTPKGETNG